MMREKGREREGEWKRGVPEKDREMVRAIRKEDREHRLRQAKKPRIFPHAIHPAAVYGIPNQLGLEYDRQYGLLNIVLSSYPKIQIRHSAVSLTSFIIRA